MTIVAEKVPYLAMGEFVLFVEKGNLSELLSFVVRFFDFELCPVDADGLPEEARRNVFIIKSYEGGALPNLAGRRLHRASITTHLIGQ